MMTSIRDRIRYQLCPIPLRWLELTPIMRVPAKEDDPRVELGPNFYYRYV